MAEREAKPARFVEARRVYPALHVTLRTDAGEWMPGDLLLWLRHPDHSWWGYCHWWDRRTIRTDVLPSTGIRPIRRKNVSVYDDGTWEHGTFHGWRRLRDDPEWQAAVRLPGWPEPAWVPASRIRPS